MLLHAVLLLILIFRQTALSRAHLLADVTIQEKLARALACSAASGAAKNALPHASPRPEQSVLADRTRPAYRLATRMTTDNMTHKCA